MKTRKRFLTVFCLFGVFLSGCVTSTELPLYSSPSSGPSASLQLPKLAQGYTLLDGRKSADMTITYVTPESCVESSEISSEALQNGDMISIPAQSLVTLRLDVLKNQNNCSVTKSFIPVGNQNYQLTFKTLYSKCSLSLYKNISSSERSPVELEVADYNNFKTCL